MNHTTIKKLFYDFKKRELIVKDTDLNTHDKKAWIPIDANPSRKDDCFYLGDLSLQDCGKFADYVKEEERTCMRDPPFPELSKILYYYEEWKERKK